MKSKAPENDLPNQSKARETSFCSKNNYNYKWVINEFSTPLLDIDGDYGPSNGEVSYWPSGYFQFPFQKNIIKTRQNT